MEMNTKIIEIEQKTAKNGRSYHRVRTDDGWLSCFESDIVEELRKYVGGFCNLAVAERGDFKNIIGLVDDSVNMPPTTFSKPIVKSAEVSKANELVRVGDKFNAMYTSYAKDIFVAMLARINEKDEFSGTSIMDAAIQYVNQAKAGFEQ